MSARIPYDASAITINSLADTKIDNILNGSILQYDNTNRKWENKNLGSASTYGVATDLNDEPDDLLLPTLKLINEQTESIINEVVLFVGNTITLLETTILFLNSQIQNLIFNNLNNVEITTPEQNQILTYDGTKWTNGIINSNKSISIGSNAGINSCNNSVAIGTNAGSSESGQGSCVAIGANAGNLQQENSIAIGRLAGGGEKRCISIGYLAGNQNQREQALAIGFRAGNNTQGKNSISLGTDAGCNLQKESCIAIGLNAGTQNQNKEAIAIGSSSGNNNQGTRSICIGNSVGILNEGEYNISIGNSCGSTADNSIVFNALASVFNKTDKGMYIVLELFKTLILTFQQTKIFYIVIQHQEK